MPTETVPVEDVWNRVLEFFKVKKRYGNIDIHAEYLELVLHRRGSKPVSVFYNLDDRDPTRRDWLHIGGIGGVQLRFPHRLVENNVGGKAVALLIGYLLREIYGLALEKPTHVS
jgi:hypothetical protein